MTMENGTRIITVAVHGHNHPLLVGRRGTVRGSLRLNRKLTLYAVEVDEPRPDDHACTTKEGVVLVPEGRGLWCAPDQMEAL